jgi:hypothetical protein
VHPGAYGARSVDTLFFMLGWIRCGFHKKRVRNMLRCTCVFAFDRICGHLLPSGASGPRNVDALFFMLGWAQYGFDKKHVETRDTELVLLHPVGSVGLWVM